ncbi:MAG: glycosyltransferase [Alistipes sp.]|nr:glycosyltransferase [Alistipes sp.]
MITCIVCSVNPDQASRVVSNLQQSAGERVEILVHDNRERRWGLCRVYNAYAERARGEILCFLHEDLRFCTKAWDVLIRTFFQKHPEAGVVGFLGSQLKTQTPSRVGGIVRYEMGSLRQHSPCGMKYYMQRSGRTSFSRVVQVDGLCMFVRKRVWQQFRFDEQRFRGFSLYDLDFSLQVAQSYCNYIDHEIVVAHKSEGRHDAAWFRNTRLFQQKWGARLPMQSIPLSAQEIRRAEAYNAYKFYRNALRTALPKKELAFVRESYLPYRTLRSRLRMIRHLIGHEYQALRGAGANR